MKSFLESSLRKSLHRSRFYLVTGPEDPEQPHRLTMIGEALKGGVDIVQLRDYSLGDGELLAAARQIREITNAHQGLFIVNNRPDIAKLSDADGVHLGQADLPVAEARKILGPGKIVGVSTHNLEQARKAVSDGADYIGVGPVFATPTKEGRRPVTLEYVRQVSAWNPPVPFFAIGGIDLSNLEEVLRAGACRVAVVRAISGAADPAGTAARFKKAMENHPLPALSLSPL